MTPSIMIVSLLFVGLSMLVSGMLKSKFKKFSQIRLSNGMSGKDIAEKMLRDNGIGDVKVVSVDGFLSDHYNPVNKTVNLSPDVYSGVSIASAAVAAHERGHAVQHNTAYTWLTMRSKLVPVVQFSSGIVQWVLLGGILLINSFPELRLGGIVLFSLTTIFSVVTLPVEFDASRRALAWIEDKKMATPAELADSKDALKWAAYTYFVSALGSITTLIYFILKFVNNNRD